MEDENPTGYIIQVVLEAIDWIIYFIPLVLDGVEYWEKNKQLLLSTNTFEKLLRTNYVNFESGSNLASFLVSVGNYCEDGYLLKII